MTAWEKLENLSDQLGAQTVLEEMARALADNCLEDVLDFIAKNWDVDLEGWDMEE